MANDWVLLVNVIMIIGPTRIIASLKKGPNLYVWVGLAAFYLVLEKPAIFYQVFFMQIICTNILKGVRKQETVRCDAFSREF